MKTTHRYAIGVLAASAVLTVFGAVMHSSDAMLAIFIASIFAGAVATEKPKAGATLGMIAVFAVTAFSALVAIEGMYTAGTIYAWPFADVVAIYAPYSGTSAEILSLLETIVVSLAGGAIGSGVTATILHFFFRKDSGTDRNQLGELDRLNRRLEMLNKERGKLEEELRICEMIEQGAKTRIARNEITQSDYDSIIYRNDNYVTKLKTRVEKVSSDIQQIRVDIDARNRAKGDGNQEKISPGLN
jgi:chaperonin cofactor prefoldin